MATEEQTIIDGQWSLHYANSGMGQYIIIPTGRIVTNLNFPMQKIGNPGSGTITYYILDWSDKSTLTSQAWGNPQSVSTSMTWYPLELSTPWVSTGNRVWIGFRNTGSGAAGNGIGSFAAYSSVKADEALSGTNWVPNVSGYDVGYIYTYSEKPPAGGGGNAPLLVADGKI